MGKTLRTDSRIWRKATKRIGAVVALGLLGITACSSSKELTRNKAKTLIEASKNYQPVRLTLLEPEIKAALASKYLTIFTVSSGYNMLTRGPLFTRAYVKVMPEGEKYFDCPCKTAQQFEAGAQWGRCPITTVATVQPHVIEVTGITDVPDAMGGGKLAEYRWNYAYDSLPSEIRKPFESRQPQAWTAKFRLYDDGWRLEGLNQ
jgi:hypothetical protein